MGLGGIGLAYGSHRFKQGDTYTNVSYNAHTHTNAGNTMNTYKQRQQRRIDIGILMVLVTTLVLTLGVIV